MNRRLFGRSGLLLVALGWPARSRAAHGSDRSDDGQPRHRVSFQISAGDAAAMNLVLGNMANMAGHYAEAGESAAIDLTAFGPGYALVRADTSSVADRLAALRERFPFVTVSGCQNSRRAVAEAERKAITDIPQLAQVRDVASGVVHLADLQERGWAYLRP